VAGHLKFISMREAAMAGGTKSTEFPPGCSPPPTR
jgi:hypothetical protein